MNLKYLSASTAACALAPLLLLPTLKALKLYEAPRHASSEKYGRYG